MSSTLAVVHAFDVLGDPVRRRLVGLLAEQDRTAGELAAIVGSEFGITQPAVSRHLRVLRDSGFATVVPQGTRRRYVLDRHGLDDAQAVLDGYARFWRQRLDALHTEIARGRRGHDQQEEHR